LTPTIDKKSNSWTVEQMKKKEKNGDLELSGDWTHLCAIYENSTFFNSLKVKESPTQLVLMEGIFHRIIITLLFVFGSCLFAYGLSFFFPAFWFEGLLDIFYCFVSVTGGGVMLCFGVLGVSQRNKITFNKDTSLTTIRYGFFPFGKCVFSQSQNLRLRLYQIDIHQATEFLDIGDSALSINHIHNDTTELIISTSKHRDSLSKAHEKLSKFIGTDIIDETWSKYELPNGKMIHYQQTPIVKDREYENDRIYIELSPDFILWRRRQKGLWVWIISILFGSFFLSYPFWPWENISELIFISILALPLGLFMFSAGVFFLIRYWRKRLIVIDKVHDTIQYQSTQRGFGAKTEICKISDVAFFQFCLWVEESSDISTSGVFELNCVDKAGVRFYLCNSKNGTQLLENANKLSERLNIPLVDSVPW
jgi:hypothetical protein